MHLVHVALDVIWACHLSITTNSSQTPLVTLLCTIQCGCGGVMPSIRCFHYTCNTIDRGMLNLHNFQNGMFHLPAPSFMPCLNSNNIVLLWAVYLVFILICQMSEHNWYRPRHFFLKIQWHHLTFTFMYCYLMTFAMSVYYSNN